VFLSDAIGFHLYSIRLLWALDRLIHTLQLSQGTNLNDRVLDSDLFLSSGKERLLRLVHNVLTMFREVTVEKGKSERRQHELVAPWHLTVHAMRLFEGLKHVSLATLAARGCMTELAFNGFPR
jgi:hypothetical protein